MPLNEQQQKELELALERMLWDMKQRMEKSDNAEFKATLLPWHDRLDNIIFRQVKLK